MTVVERFPHRVRNIEHVWIPMPDGCRLAARIWLPEDAQAQPVPAILEYIPYRKRDFTRWRDEPMHHYFAGHGYAAVRADVRGTGESDGILLDEYLEQEQADAVTVIEWIARQPWCTGAVGMMGKSWGGFNALQVAARQPPALKAIITVCSTDDRYADDAHYMGGCLLNENLNWGSALLTVNGHPPDPELVGRRWRETWLERLEHAVLFPETWLRHQRRDAYWKHGSVCEDYDAIRCPVYAVGGWADGYRNAIPRLLAGLRVPRKGLIGPWAHVYPHDGVPGPAIGFLQEALRWWDHWLKDFDTGLMNEPMLRAWMQDSVPPQDFYDTRPGRWVAEDTWPSPHIEKRCWALNAEGLDTTPGEAAELRIASPQTVGLAGGDWCAFGVDGEMPADQRPDDAGSLVFDSAPLAGTLEILGAPAVELELSADRPQALVAARLCDVAPDGAATRVTYGLLNLTHRDGHENPRSLVPGKRVRVRVQLNDIAHAFPAGHRLRVSLSTAYWPIAWPSPQPAALTVVTGTGWLELPLRPPRASDADLPAFAPPEAAPRPAHVAMRAGQTQRTTEHDPETGETTLINRMAGEDLGGAELAWVEAIDLQIGQTVTRRFSVRPDDPLSARAEVTQRTELGREDWRTRIETRTRFSSDAADFRLEAEIVAYEGEDEIFRRVWDRRVPRDNV